MHIAVCDDNFADRHQMERLLGRESDKETDTSRMFYVDSYGSPETMLAHPKAYDIFFIDICKTEGLDALKIVNDLIESGANAPFVMCCSDIDYRKLDFPENTLFIDKPIKVADLKEVLDQARKLKEAAPDTIELRDLAETIYANVDDCLYARDTTRDTVVTLADGRKLTSIGKVWLFKRSLGEKHPEFINANAGTVINCNHVKAVKACFVIMEDGKIFFLTKGAKAGLEMRLRKDNS